MVNVELRHLRSFVAVAEELHFGRAARRLHLTQQALSGHVRQLEVLLDVTLLERTTRVVRLTPAGVALLEPARRTLAEAQRAVETVEAAKRGAHHRLTVAVFGFAAYDLVVAIARRLAAGDPPVAVTQVEHPDRRGVLDGRADAALGTPLELPDGLRAETVFTEPVVVALPAGHPLAARGRVALGDLAAEPIAMPAPGVAPEWDQMVAAAAERVGVRLRAAPATFGNLATALGVANEGQVPVLLTGEVARWPLAGVEVRPVDPPLSWVTAILWAPDRETVALRAFLDAARSVARERDADTIG